jgi:hypothetical protein
MGRAALLIALVLGLAACRPDSVTVGHEALACARCHQGGMSDRSIAAVPPETCSDGQCHAQLSTVAASARGLAVRFEHSAHDSIEAIAVGCAGCHTHSEGEDPIPGDVGSCGLCHQEELAGPGGQGCRECHVDLTHEGVTSQGLVIPHQDFPSFAKGCLRCHFQVSEPVPEVAAERCTACHADRTEILEAGIGIDLHPPHLSISCGACHETDTHRIEAMSSAVSLRCSDCHSVEHEVPIEGLEGWSTTCIDCHRDTHAEEQALVLGIEPGRESPRPAEHFSEGLTCASCHPTGSGTRPIRASSGGAVCESCHRPGYATIERWWSEGIRSRLDAVDAYLATAEAVGRRRQIGADDRRLLETMRARLELVRAGEGAHNVYLAHDVFVDVVDAAERVLVGAGVGTAPPALGGHPREGFCSYCHYGPEVDQQRWDTALGFHRN